MKLISYENEEDAFALLKKQMKSRKIENVVDLLQCEVNRIRKKYFENIVMSRGGRPQAQTTWEKMYTRLFMHLDICPDCLSVSSAHKPYVCLVRKYSSIFKYI
jgi:hypothetical protein